VVTVCCIGAQDLWVIVALPDLRRDPALQFSPRFVDALNDLAEGQFDKLVKVHAEILPLCVCPGNRNSLFLVRSKEQEATISQLKKGMEVFAATLEQQAAQIQKVSAQLEVNKTAPQIVLNNH
jgi:hypothetical protein